MATTVLRNEESHRAASPRRWTPIATGHAGVTPKGRLRGDAPDFGAGAIRPRVGRRAADLPPTATDGGGEIPRAGLYPLRIAARVFLYIGIATVFYALVLVAVFIQSEIVAF